MADWFRKSTWTPADTEDFERRLSRARVKSRPQYLRIQSVHLLETGKVELIAAALCLATRVTSEYPDSIEASPAHHCAGLCREALDDAQAALRDYRNAVDAEDRVPSVQTDAYLDFAWLVAIRQLRSHYGQALQLLLRYRDRPVFPIQRYRHHAAAALIAHDQNEDATAKAAAQSALVAARETKSPFCFHPHLGLVTQDLDTIRKRLEVLAT